MNAIIEFSDALAVSRCTLAIGVIIWSLEYIALAKHLINGRILSWEVGQLRYSWSVAGVPKLLTEWCFGPLGTFFHLATRIFAAMLLLSPDQSSTWYALALLVVAASSLSWWCRSPQGQDGSDQIFFILAGAMTIGYAVDSAITWSFVTYFITSQLTLCYSTAGLTKLFSHEWRNGDAIGFVFRTSTYGNTKLSYVITVFPLLKFLIAWFVIMFEVMFPLLFVAPLSIRAYLLLIPLFFHLLTALLMGLNLFLVSFIAAYPFIFLLVAS